MDQIVEFFESIGKAVCKLDAGVIIILEEM
jgi:hypothetical protein